jgi:hypothetical protein
MWPILYAQGRYPRTRSSACVPWRLRHDERATMQAGQQRLSLQPGGGAPGETRCLLREEEIP